MLRRVYNRPCKGFDKDYLYLFIILYLFKQFIIFSIIKCNFREIIKTESCMIYLSV